MNFRNKKLAGWALTVLLALPAGNAMAGGFVDLYPATFPADAYNLTNPWWPLGSGNRYVYFEEDECVLGIVDVLPAITKEIKGVDVRTVLDREYEFSNEDDDCDGETDYDNPDPEDWELVEITYDWYAQDVDGNIWYMGEHSVAFGEDPAECDHYVLDDGVFGEEGCMDGSWLAGTDIWEEEPDAEIREGIIMLDEPQKGLFYFQEYWEEEATDMAKILKFKKVDEGLYDEQEGCLVTKEWVPLEPGNVEHKYYCYGLGLVLVEGNAGGPTVFEELIYVDP